MHVGLELCCYFSNRIEKQLWRRRHFSILNHQHTHAHLFSLFPNLFVRMTTLQLQEDLEYWKQIGTELNAFQLLLYSNSTTFTSQTKTFVCNIEFGLHSVLSEIFQELFFPLHSAVSSFSPSSSSLVLQETLSSLTPSVTSIVTVPEEHTSIAQLQNPGFSAFCHVQTGYWGSRLLRVFSRLSWGNTALTHFHCNSCLAGMSHC